MTSKEKARILKELKRKMRSMKYRNPASVFETAWNLALTRLTNELTKI